MHSLCLKSRRAMKLISATNHTLSWSSFQLASLNHGGVSPIWKTTNEKLNCEHARFDVVWSVVPTSARSNGNACAYQVSHLNLNLLHAWSNSFLANKLKCFHTFKPNVILSKCAGSRQHDWGTMKPRGELLCQNKTCYINKWVKSK